MKVFKIAKAPALECCSLLNASYATFIWKQRPVGKKGIWEQRGIPRASWLLQTQLSLSNPSSCSGHRHNHLPQVSSALCQQGRSYTQNSMKTTHPAENSSDPVLLRGAEWRRLKCLFTTAALSASASLLPQENQTPTDKPMFKFSWDTYSCFS